MEIYKEISENEDEDDTAEELADVLDTFPRPQPSPDIPFNNI